MKKYLYSTICVLLSLNVINAQNRTVGTTVFENGTLDGYTFFSPFSGRNAYMIDNCGNLINQWDRNSLPGLAAYFQSDGNILRTYKVSPVGPFTSASNAGGIELVDWENNTVWSYELNTDTELSHHDATLLPNGNILLLTWELIQKDELEVLGRNPNEIAPPGFVWGERIIEIKPIGDSEAEIIWEWRIKDHFIQDRDSSLENFGVIAENAQLFDINLPDINSSNSHSDLDYNHFNAIDYREDLDQILISVRNSDELWILDHSTTTAEAASHEGGRSGMGGDILYRWGNPSAYQGASISKQRFFGQHGVNWIDEGPDENKILVYNNGNGRPGTDFSTIEILEPPLNADGTYEKMGIEPFGPEAVNWKYGDEEKDRFYSPFLSNAQFLTNGNILINAGSRGEIFEINSEKELVWKYIIPLFGDFPATQGDNVNNNATFRAYKYSTEFVGFDGIDVQVNDPIEVDPIPFQQCDIMNSISMLVNDELFNIYVGNGFLKFENLTAENLNLKCFDIRGKLIKHIQIDDLDLQLSTYNMSSGLYFFVATDEHKRQFVRQAAVVN